TVAATRSRSALVVALQPAEQLLVEPLQVGIDALVDTLQVGVDVFQHVTVTLAAGNRRGRQGADHETGDRGKGKALYCELHGTDPPHCNNCALENRARIPAVGATPPGQG